MRSRVALIEAAVVIVAFLLGWAYLAGWNGYPYSWDELLYMDTAFNTKPLAIILNRYSHIYAYKLFITLNDGDPFRAANIYWGLLVSATVTLSYVCARLLTDNRRTVSIIASLLVVLFIVSQPFILEFPGVLYADYGVMLMIVLAAVLYLLAQRFARFRLPLLVLLGLVFFFGLKTKETSFAIGVLLLGLGFESDGRYRVARLFRNGLAVLAGMVAGQVVFMILDQAILGDALFGLRPENWQRLLTFNLREEFQRTAGNYLQNLAGNEALVLTVLALFAAAQPEVRDTPQKKIVWLLPVAVISFLTLTMISGGWGVLPRYTLIMAPILSVLAACYFCAVLSRASHAILWLVSGLLVGWILAQAVIIPWATTYHHWDETDFRVSVLMPMAVLGAGILAVTLRSRGELVVLAWSLCAGLVLMPPAVQVLENLNGGATRAQQSVERWTPYAVFGSLIQPSDEMRLLTLPSLYEAYRYGGREYSMDSRFFNLYFRTNLSASQFVHQNIAPSAFSQVEPTYVLMTADDWHQWEDADRLAVLDAAQVFTDNQQQMILINYGAPVPEVQPGVAWFPVAAGYRNCLIVAKEAEPGVYEFQCYAQESEDYTILGWTYQAGDGSIGTSVAEGSAVTEDQLKQMAYSFDLYPDASN